MAPAENIRRLNDDALDHQFTAKDLIGKELYDRDGKRIGEVKDVVLASSTNPQLASSLSTRKEATSGNYTKENSTSGSGTTRTASGSVGGVGATGSVRTDDSGVAVTGSAGRSRSGDTSGTSMASEMARHAGTMMGAMSEDAVVVSYGGFLGAGNSLIRVPLSQLNYDASHKHIMINIAESELASLPEITETTRSAAE